MSSVLHPSGPDRPETYWVRRIGVVVAALVVVLVVAWAWPGGGGGNTTADPQGSVTPSTTPGPTGTGSSPAGSPMATAGSDASPTPHSSATPASGASTASSSASTPASPTSRTAKSRDTTKPTTKPTATTKPVPACSAGDTRVTLTGPRTVTIDKSVTFKLSAINGADTPCRLAITSDTFELKIYSGTDRIWSTRDCDTWQQAIPERTVKSQQEVDWTAKWTGKRSHHSCTLADNLRPGTYVATAQLTLGGHKVTPVQLVMRLTR